MNKDKVYVIIPIYNETLLLHEIITQLLAHSYSNIVVIDDGSALNIREIVMNLPVIYIRHKINLGQGAALQTGFEYVKKMNFDAVVTFDGDGQHNVDDIAKLLSYIDDGSADISLGSRFLNNGKSQVPFVRRLILQTARLINLVFSGLLLTYAHNGLRALNKKAVELIHFSENRMAHASEILFQIKKNQLRFKEVPVFIKYDPTSAKKGQSSIDSVKILFDLVLHKLFE
ncbi:MAG TPA: glycosyltransferase family 2 protein [Chitinophagaceae bacterium]|nr:glycosyltransferase family 2 protein [Chitinophagaceae bacterium]